MVSAFFTKTKGDKMKTSRTSILLAFILLASLSVASAKTIVTIRGSFTNTLDPNAVIEVGVHLTGPSISLLDIAPFDGQGFLEPETAAPLALARCRFALSGEWVHEDRAFYVGGTVRSSADPRLVGARFFLAVSATDGGFFSFYFDTDPDNPQIGGPLEYHGRGSIEIHETK